MRAIQLIHGMHKAAFGGAKLAFIQYTRQQLSTSNSHHVFICKASGGQGDCHTIICEGRRHLSLPAKAFHLPVMFQASGLILVFPVMYILLAGEGMLKVMV